jgi:hypothetical protein
MSWSLEAWCASLSKGAQHLVLEQVFVSTSLGNGEGG